MESGYLKVGGGHEIFYQCIGNPKGIPVLFLHGGPGLGISDEDHRFFDKEKFRVVLFDQRGSGRSTPAGSVENNNTGDVLEDILLLLEKFDFKRVLLFGGSWGSTLALLFAIKYPEYVSGMILRAVFLGTKESRAQFETGLLKDNYPIPWKRLNSLIPNQFEGSVADHYFKQILSEDFQIQKIYAYEWMVYGMSMLRPELPTKDIIEKVAGIDPVNRMKIQAHYSLNNFFIPDNYILENMDTIANIPTQIVHGQNDLLCDVRFAKQLQDKFLNADLHIEKAGHLAEEMEERLKKCLESIKN